MDINVKNALWVNTSILFILLTMKKKAAGSVGMLGEKINNLLKLYTFEPLVTE